MSKKPLIYLVWYVDPEGRVRICRVTDSIKKAKKTMDNCLANKSDIEQSWIETRQVD
jgi:hypothetical protein